MTSPIAPLSRGKKFRIIACMVAVLAFYVYAWHVVLTPDAPVHAGWFLLGAALFPVVNRLRLLPALVVLAVALFGTQLVGGDAGVDNLLLGECAFIVCAVPIFVVTGIIRAWKGVGIIDLDDLDTEGSRKIIGLSGYAGAGKDTAAKGLLEDGWTRVSFADKLREFALVLDPLIPATKMSLDPHDWPGESGVIRLSNLVDKVGWHEAKKNPEVRGLLQRLGTEAGRNKLGENVWVDAVMRDLPEGNIVFTDCRFPNEAEAIKAAGGHVVRVERPGVLAVNAHPSETALDEFPFDATVLNASDEQTLARGVRVLTSILT